MSLGSDAIIDMEISAALCDIEEELWIKRDRQMKKCKWQDKHGNIHKVREMDSSHIRNIIRLFNGNPFAKYCISCLHRELAIRAIL